MKPFADRVSKLRQAPNTRVGQGVDPSIAETTTMAKAPVARPVQQDPTIVAPVPGPVSRDEPQVQTGSADDVDNNPAAPIDQIQWANVTEPELSGDGVWISPTEPPAKPGEDGQFRLWD